jgi:PPM family protein phosphatase
MTNRGLSFETAALTDAGKVRKKNEDRLFVLEKELPNALGAGSFGIYLVADGMGGHRAGEVASDMAASIISRTLIASLSGGFAPPSPILLLKQAIETANAEIVRLSGKQKGLKSMGTTVTAGLRLDNDLYLGHVGDSRAYLMRKDVIHQITEDHSVVAYLLNKGLITQDQAKNHPDQGKIYRSLGASENVEIDMITRTLEAGDSLVFCSDGIPAYLAEGEIGELVKGSADAREACKKLIEMANYRGGEDNSSVIVTNIRTIAKPGNGC